MSHVRPPAVAGLFYPADARELADSVDRMLAAAPEPDAYSRVVIAPHAGHMYSGEIAAFAYRQLDPATSRIAVLGPCHRVGIDAMALTGASAQRTPLGELPTDTELTQRIAAMTDVIEAPVVHAQEHSIEVHLPFIQRRFGTDTRVLPIAVGQTDPTFVADVIEEILAEDDTAIIISTDLSHFLPEADAHQVDAATIGQILEMSGTITGFQACGCFPVNGLLAYGRRVGLRGSVLAAGTSADTSGDSSRVVGYVAMAFSSSPADSALPALAYNAIARQLSAPEIDVVGSIPEGLGTSFVTLSALGRLRGCMGGLVAVRELSEDIAAHAVTAAFSDPRFPPLSKNELATLDIDVSILSPPNPPRTFESASEACAALRPGVDGVILSYGPHRATFLPQVWHQLPQPEVFLRHLLAKAGMDPESWHHDIEVSTYTVTSHELKASER